MTCMAGIQYYEYTRRQVNAEPAPGYPKRPTALSGLPMRTWLSMVAVAAAYGWPDDITDSDALRELLGINGRR